MLIKVNNNLFINTKNISFARLRLKKNRLEFTELGNDNLEDIEISDEGQKELCNFFKFDEDFIEISICYYINVRAISKISINDDEKDDKVKLSINFINDKFPWAETISRETATEIINEIRKKITKIKYVDHF